MISKRRYRLLLLAPRYFPVKTGVWAAKFLPGTAGEKFENMVTELFLKFFLGGLGLSFRLSSELRQNLLGFEGKYVIRSRNGSIREGVIFKQDENKIPVMKREDEPVDDPDATVIFKDAGALRDYLFSLADADILELILENRVYLGGNLNYVCKLLFIIRELHYTFRLNWLLFLIRYLRSKFGSER